MKDRDIRECLAVNLKRLMNDRGYNATDLSKRSGVSGRMIGYLLKKERAASIEVLQQIAKAFRVSPSSLIDSEKQQGYQISEQDAEYLSQTEGLTQAEKENVKSYVEFITSKRGKI